MKRRKILTTKKTSTFAFIKQIFIVPFLLMLLIVGLYGASNRQTIQNLAAASCASYSAGSQCNTLAGCYTTTPSCNYTSTQCSSHPECGLIDIPGNCNDFNVNETACKSNNCSPKYSQTGCSNATPPNCGIGCGQEATYANCTVGNCSHAGCTSTAGGCVKRSSTSTVSCSGLNEIGCTSPSKELYCQWKDPGCSGQYRTGTVCTGQGVKTFDRCDGTYLKDQRCTATSQICTGVPAPPPSTTPTPYGHEACNGHCINLWEGCYEEGSGSCLLQKCCLNRASPTPTTPIGRFISPTPNCIKGEVKCIRDLQLLPFDPIYVDVENNRYATCTETGSGAQWIETGSCNTDNVCENGSCIFIPSPTMGKCKGIGSLEFLGCTGIQKDGSNIYMKKCNSDLTGIETVHCNDICANNKFGCHCDFRLHACIPNATPTPTPVGRAPNQSCDPFANPNDPYSQCKWENGKIYICINSDGNGYKCRLPPPKSVPNYGYCSDDNQCMQGHCGPDDVGGSFNVCILNPEGSECDYAEDCVSNYCSLNKCVSEVEGRGMSDPLVTKLIYGLFKFLKREDLPGG